MRIGIVGAGMIGSTLSKLWIDAGHEVRLASRHPRESSAADREIRGSVHRREHRLYRRATFPSWPGGEDASDGF